MKRNLKKNLTFQSTARSTTLSTALVLSAASAVGAAPAARISVEAGAPGKAISPMLYGVFFEEINRAGDGGIYAEMVQNRSFEDAASPLGWALTGSGGARSRFALDKSRPLNPQNPTSLRLEVTGSGGRAGVASDGFRGVPINWGEVTDPNRVEEMRGRFDAASGGMAVERNKVYDLSLYAAASPGSGPLTASIETYEGRVLASQTLPAPGSGWRKYSVSLRPSASDPTARLVISSQRPGTYWLDMVSMFPRETWRGRKNGLRADLMEKIAAIRPAFVRFPGGCFVEGDQLANAWRWKETIGPIEARPGRWNLWGYRSTDGLGFHEYLQMCEDLGAEPLFVINCGMSHENGRLNASAVPMDQMGPWVQDAVDAIEYANGPVTSKWGALRARNGHPAPFNLKYLQVGNENGGPTYNERYALFHDAVKAKYPQVQLIACDWGGVPNNRPLDIIDPHLYSNPRTLLSQHTRFDSADRQGPKIYFGEYAVTQESGTGNLQAAVAEAAFMAGMERNGDIVKMSSYAPLLSHISWKRWNPNAIVFDQARVYGTPSYHVQAMFGQNRASRTLPVSIQQPQREAEPIRGMVGLGTWNTQAEFRAIKVTCGGQTLFQSDFTNGLRPWRRGSGSWSAEGGVLRQTGNEQGASVMVGDRGWSDYTLSLQARKTGGDEGFLIHFGSPGGDAKSWFNLGGWNNTAHGIEMPGGASDRVPGRIEAGRWYDIRIELSGPTAKAYLDGQLVQQYTRGQGTALYAVAGTAERPGEAIVKVINASDEPVETAVEMRGLPSGPLSGQALVLGGSGPMEENSFERPRAIAPRAEAFRVAAPTFTRTFPAHSVTVLRLKR